MHLRFRVNSTTLNCSQGRSYSLSRLGRSKLGTVGNFLVYQKLWWWKLRSSCRVICADNWILKKRKWHLVHLSIQGASGIDARFLKVSPASAVSPIIVYPTLHLLLCTGFHLLARLKGPRKENQRAVIVKKIRAGWGKMENTKFKKQGIWELQFKA